MRVVRVTSPGGSSAHQRWLGLCVALSLVAACSDQPHDDVPAQSGTAAASVVEMPVSFRVVNRNTTQLPCATDGLEYEIRGQLFAPAGALHRKALAVTLYTHGLVFGISGWRFSGLPGYDFPVEMARLGHVSIVYDKLGYGSSGLPDGLFTCISADADMASQIVTQLKSGDYQADGRPGPAFDKIALAGISGGGGAAEIVAHTFQAADALVVMSWADLGNNPALTVELGSEAGATCLSGGEPKNDGGPEHYVYFARENQEIFFHDAEPAVIEYVRQYQERDPCGSLAQVPAVGPFNRRNVASITVPVLVVMGELDALYAPGTAGKQAALYTGSADVTAIEMENTGHGLRGERTAPVFRAHLSGWLQTRGF